MSAGFLNALRLPSHRHPRRPVLFLSKFMIRVSSKIRNVVVLIAAACSGLIFFLEDWQRDLSVNQARLDQTATNQLLRPLVLDIEPVEAAEKTKQWVSANKMWDIASESSDDGSIKLHLTRTTRLMRFVDDIHVEFQPHNTGVIIQATSQSRVGKGDLGQNPRNLLELVKALIQTQNE